MRLKDLDDQWLLRTHFLGVTGIGEDGKLTLPNPSNPSEVLPAIIIQDAIDAAIARIESTLSVSIRQSEQIVEWHDYDRDLYSEFMHIVTRHYPVIQVRSLQLTYGENGGVIWDVPSEMIQIKGSGSRFGLVKVLPMLGVSRNYDPAIGTLLYTTFGQHYAPSMLKLTYDYGLDGLADSQGSPIHLDNMLVRAIGLLAAIHPLNILGDLLIGAGIANLSMSLDGISQSIGTTASAENSAFSSRIIMYRKELYGEQGIPGLMEALMTQWRRPPIGLL